MVAEEQAVIAERRHGDANLSQIIQVLQHRSLEEKRASCYDMPQENFKEEIKPQKNRKGLDVLTSDQLLKCNVSSQSTIRTFCGLGGGSDLSKQQPMGDVFRQHEPRHQVMDRPRFPAVRPQNKGVRAALPGIKTQCRKYWEPGEEQD